MEAWADACQNEPKLATPRSHQATSPFTLFELGFDFNHTKPLMRLLRNRGVLAAMPVEERLELASWLLNCTHGDLARKLHHMGRADLHRLVKEAFLCVAESCTKGELQLVGGCSWRDV